MENLNEEEQMKVQGGNDNGISNRECPMCKSTSVYTHSSLDGPDVYECKSCGHMWS